jgi:hypothetical protein
MKKRLRTHRLRASSDMNKAQEILSAPGGLFGGMRATLKGGYVGSTLALVYSLIDVHAWMALPKSRDEVKRQDFIGWAEKYVLPFGDFDCTAADLYAARCGVLHTFTPESRMSRGGSATPIIYSWGDRAPVRREALQKAGAACAMVHLDTLCSAVEEGSRKFWADVQGDPRRLELANRRARMYFRSFTPRATQTSGF